MISFLKKISTECLQIRKNHTKDTYLYHDIIVKKKKKNNCNVRSPRLVHKHFLS